MKSYLAPYKGERYHLPEFPNSGQPSGSREMFNYMHSSLRSVIELLQNMPNYKVDKQVAIITASMALHNFIRKEAIADVEFQSYDENQDYVSEDGESFVDLTIDKSEMKVIRDRIARELLLR
ncbi:hypothetical protein ACOSQ3_006717 [Xanthoceras sorbifolium]